MSDPAQLLVDHLDIWTGAIERKSGVGRGNGGKISLYGIDKLRSLILDLAVLGKLVPQDPADGDAGELLRRARQAINQAVARKQMRAPKAPKFEPPEAELPQGWVWARLIDVAQINPRNEAEDDSEASFVPMPLISDRVDGAHETETRRWGDIRSGYTHFADGDIALAKITPCFENGKAVVFAGLENGIGAGTTELHVARPVLPDFDRRFLLLTLKTPRYLAEGEAGMTGTAGQKRVPRGYFELTPFPLPPLAEQKRIVAKVDELMALVDALEAGTRAGMEAHETLVRELLATLVNSQDADDLAQNWSRIETHFDALFTTEESIDALKQTVLELAVRGKLVRQDASDEPSSMLLKKITAHNTERVASGRSKKMRSNSEVAGGSPPFTLPKNWVWTTLDRLAYKITDGAHHTPNYTDSGVPFLSVKDMSGGVLDFSDTRFISEEQHLELYKRCDPELGDLLITKVGTTGVPVIVDTDQPFSLFVSVALVKAPWDLLSVEYLRLLVDSPFVRKQSADGTQGVGNKNLVLRTIGAFRLPLPPFREQKRIVAKVDELLNLCETLRAKIVSVTSMQGRVADAANQWASD